MVRKRIIEWTIYTETHLRHRLCYWFFKTYWRRNVYHVQPEWTVGIRKIPEFVEQLKSGFVTKLITQMVRPVLPVPTTTRVIPVLIITITGMFHMMDYIQTPIQLVAKPVNLDFTAILASKKIARLVLIVIKMGSFIQNHVKRDIFVKEGHRLTPYLVPWRNTLKMAGPHTLKMAGPHTQKMAGPRWTPHTMKLAGLNAKAVLLDSSVMVVSNKTAPKEAILNFPTQFLHPIYTSSSRLNF